jgi:hypothetical protein
MEFKDDYVIYSVPDGGTAAMFLAASLPCLACLRRKT